MMTMVQIRSSEVENLDIPLEHNLFMRTLISKLSEVLDDIVGLEETSGFISVVGQQIGTQINNDYKQALKVSNLSREQIGMVLVNLKRRIQGDFYIIEEKDSKIVIGSRACPFADKVKDRQSLCMMTSNIFGVIATENNGYGKVVLEKTIARGYPECRVVVYLKPGEELNEIEGKEYFQTA
jgi:predicted ArsR family transcriptional regulator